MADLLVPDGICMIIQMINGSFQSISSCITSLYAMKTSRFITIAIITPLWGTGNLFLAFIICQIHVFGQNENFDSYAYVIFCLYHNKINVLRPKRLMYAILYFFIYICFKYNYLINDLES